MRITDDVIHQVAANRSGITEIGRDHRRGAAPQDGRAPAKSLAIEIDQNIDFRCADQIGGLAASHMRDVAELITCGGDAMA